MHASQTDNGQHLLMALTRYQRKREGGRLLIRFGCERSERLQRNFHIYIYMYKAEDRRKDRRYRFGEISILFERMLKVIKGELQFS